MRWKSMLWNLLFPGLLLAQRDHAGSGMIVPSDRALNGSGTSRLPEATPMYAIHSDWAGWEIMTHGNLYLRFTRQNFNNSGRRSDDGIDFPNWLMLMGGKDFSKGRHRIDLRTMLSLDRLTEGGNGYPLLFATGETWQGAPLVDRQHPHDLFMELAVMFSHRLSRDDRIFLYLGMPGEPALGPTAYMHRPANQTNPDAILSHPSVIG